MVGWPKQMPSDPKEIQDNSVDRQESLCLTGRFEPSHLALTLPGWLMRDFSTIVGVSACVVEDGRHHSPMRCPVALQLVGDQAPRFAFLALQELSKEPLGCTPIATWLHQYVDDIAVLIDRAPEILPLALDRHEELV